MNACAGLSLQNKGHKKMKEKSAKTAYCGRLKNSSIPKTAIPSTVEANALRMLKPMSVQSPASNKKSSK
jgi:hypothetical protein